MINPKENNNIEHSKQNNTTIKFFNNQTDSYPTNSNELVGGINQEWKIINLEYVSKISVEQPHPDGMTMEDYLDVIIKKFNRIDFPITLNPETASFNDVALHALLRQRKAKGTIIRNMRYARFMEKHTIPVNFRQPSYENFIQHMDYREQIDFKDGGGHGALRHEWQTMKMFLRAYGIPKWDYKPPTTPTYRVIPIPFPEQVHKILHLKYSKDNYENALIQYILCHNFIVGWRPPSEPSIMKVSDVKIDDLNRGYLKITEPKKKYSTRNITPVEIMTNKRRKSFKNWIDSWRPQVENHYSKDYLYLKPNGKPFTSESLRMFLNRKAGPTIKTVFPEYYNYTSRHFCAIARLIRTKIETKHYDAYEVRDWLGHTKIETTMSYLKDAKHYYQLAPYDWIHRALKATGKCGGECTEKSKTTKKRLLWLKSLRGRCTPPTGLEPVTARLTAECSTN